jgi:predicted hotdog family 3-hydroxylacyl-ACP dehydratase
MQGLYPVGNLNKLTAHPPLDQARIRQLVPHSGPMCLLERATFWDERRIRCEASSHLHPGNPLRAGGVLRAITGIEYAAQAMALHSALLQHGTPGEDGYLVSARDVWCKAVTLDRAGGQLEIDAERLTGDGSSAIYAFALRAAGTEILRGRAAVRLAQHRFDRSPR